MWFVKTLPTCFMYLPCERTESLNILLGLYRIYIEVFVMGYLSIDDVFFSNGIFIIKSGCRLLDMRNSFSRKFRRCFTFTKANSSIVNIIVYRKWFNLHIKHDYTFCKNAKCRHIIVKQTAQKIRSWDSLSYKPDS